MKILLTYISGAADRSEPYINLLPAGLCYLHACLSDKGYDTTLANFSAWRESAIVRQLNLLKPDVVGISQWTHNRHESLRLARLVRRNLPDALILFGGGHATFCYQDLLGEDSPVDLVALGEGEPVLLALAESLTSGQGWKDVPGIAFRHTGKIKVNAPAQFVADLDRLPFPSRYLGRSLGVDADLQAEFILTARGCPAACHFCSSPGFWNRKLRFRSAANIVDEILSIRDRQGLIYFSLRDDTFTADRKRAIEFCRLLIERKAYILWNCQSRVSALDEELLVWMKRAGCECVQLGVESGSPRILELLGKRITAAQVEQASQWIRKVGINLSVYLISDIPNETEQDLAQTCDLIKRIRPDDGYVSPLAYFPGTKLFEQAVAEGKVPADIFQQNPDQAVYVAGKPGMAGRQLIKVLTASAPRGPERFKRHKEFLGHCYTTNVLAGEWYRQAGQVEKAAKEFREIVEREADNPWGWYLLAELYVEQAKAADARDCYRELLRIVPQHKGARQALKER